MSLRIWRFIGTLFFLILAIQGRITFANPSLEACVVVDNQLNASLPCVEYNDQYYWAKLNADSDSQDASWRLGEYGTTTAISGCGFLDQALQLTLPCVSANNINYKVSLRSRDPGLTWSLGSITQFSITNVQPSSAVSGEVIMLTGAGFTSASQISLAGENIFTEYISDTQLRGIVPFSRDDKGQLLPFSPGMYEITVDQGNPVILEIKDLPENTQPTGQVMVEAVDDIKNAFLDISIFLDNLPQLLDSYQNNQEMQQFITDLADVLNMFHTSGIDEFSNQINQLDSQTLSTLERAITAQKNNQESLGNNNVTENAAPKLYSIFQSNRVNVPVCKDIPNAEAWLLCRSPIIPAARRLDQLTTILSFIRSPWMTASPILAATMHEINITEKSGLIKKIKLHISGTDSDDNMDQSRSNIPVLLNNYDNNEELIKQTANAKNITGATLFITYTPGWFTLLNKIKSAAGMLANYSHGNVVIDAIVDKLEEIASKKLDKELNNNFVQKEIIVDTLEGERRALNFIPSLLDSGSCDIDDGVGGHLLKTTSDKKWIVPDVGTVIQPYNNYGICKFNVKETLRLPYEDELGPAINFYIARYPKLTLTVDSNFEVMYENILPLSNNTVCNNTLSPCKEYFSTQQPPLKLLAHKTDGTATSDTRWSGIGAENCSGEMCTTSLDLSNHQAPDIAINNDKDGIYEIYYTFEKQVASLKTNDVVTYSEVFDQKIDISTVNHGFYSPSPEFGHIRDRVYSWGMGESGMYSYCPPPEYQPAFSGKICKKDGKFIPINQTISAEGYAGYGGINGYRSFCSVIFTFDGLNYEYKLKFEVPSMRQTYTSKASIGKTGATFFYSSNVVYDGPHEESFEGSASYSNPYSIREIYLSPLPDNLEACKNL